MGYIQSKSEEKIVEWLLKSFKKLEKNMAIYFEKWSRGVEINKRKENLLQGIIKNVFRKYDPNEIYDSKETALSNFSKMLKDVVVDNGDKELSCWRIAALLDTVIKFENKKELVLVFNNEKAGKISCHLLDQV